MVLEIEGTVGLIPMSDGVECATVEAVDHDVLQGWVQLEPR